MKVRFHEEHLDKKFNDYIKNRIPEEHENLI